MRYRRIESKLWTRPWFASLAHDARCFYLWCWTSAHADRAGVICALDGVVETETGIGRKRIAQIGAQLQERIFAPVPCVYLVAGWCEVDTDNPNMAQAAIECVLEHEPAVRAAWLAANEAAFVRKGFDGCDRVRASLEGIDLPEPPPPAAVIARAPDPHRAAVVKNAAARAAFDAWAAVVDPKAQPTRGRLAHFAARVREGMTAADAGAIARWAVSDDFMSGRANGRPYTDVDNLFKSREKVEKYLRAAAQGNGATTKPVEMCRGCGKRRREVGDRCMRCYEAKPLTDAPPPDPTDADRAEMDAAFGKAEHA